MDAATWLLGQCPGAVVKVPAVAAASQRHTVRLGGACAEYDASPECASWPGFLAEMQQLFLGREGDVMLGSVCVARLLLLQGDEHQAAAPSCFVNAAQWMLAAGCVGGVPPPKPAVVDLHCKAKCITDVGGGDENEGGGGDILSDEDEGGLFSEEDAAVTEHNVTLRVSAHSTAKQVADALLGRLAQPAAEARAVTVNLSGGRQVLRLARLAVGAPWMLLPARDFTGALWAWVTCGFRPAGDALERPVPVVRRAVGVHLPA